MARERRTGRPTRESLFVEDCAEAIVRAATDYDDPEPLNIGSGREIAIADHARMVADLSGFDGEIR